MTPILVYTHREFNGWQLQGDTDILTKALDFVQRAAKDGETDLKAHIITLEELQWINHHLLQGSQEIPVVNKEQWSL